ncbi:hypothetical protein LV82_01223 [Albidovulum inexpectatum]|uniref:DUF3618 domain-containing protein n=1 Tax=Albidovulum inexpectatum TaxID=196587 RepID=A0A2S5JIH2_9RHOB|nr:hypothetical protein [Albidovulum inexpectatum]PPB81181.1 hypothetical protein LV82_01223 [Albidovulum inexpectatum]
MAEATLTPDQIEREIEAERGALRRTLQDAAQLVPGSAMAGDVQKALGRLAEDAAERLPRTIRDNPLPAALIAAGVGWLTWSLLRGDRDGATGEGTGGAYGFVGEGQAARPRVASASGAVAAPLDDSDDRFSESARADTSIATRAQQIAEDWGERLSGNAEALSQWLSEGTEKMSEAARARVIAARQKALDAQVQMERAARNARRQISRTVEQQPLLPGVVGFVAGLVLGAVMPSTRREDEMLGPWRDRAFDEAERIFREESQKLARVAEATVEEGRKILDETLETARESVPEGDKAVEGALDKTKSAAERLAETARHEAERQNLGKIG